MDKSVYFLNIRFNNVFLLAKLAVCFFNASLVIDNEVRGHCLVTLIVCNLCNTSQISTMHRMWRKNVTRETFIYIENKPYFYKCFF